MAYATASKLRHVDVIARARRSFVADCRAHRLTPDYPCEAHLAHQPFHGTARDCKHARIICTQGLAHAIRRKVVCEHAGDLGLEGQILPLPGDRRDALVVSGWGDRLDAAGRLNSIGTAVIVDKPDHRRNGRSSTVRAQYADAVLGGNQGDAVTIARVAKDRCIARRWPHGRPVIGKPVQMVARKPISTDEA